MGTTISKKGLREHEIILFKNPLDENNVNQVENYEIISIFIYSNLTKQLIDKLAKARLVATRSTGFDHIDLEECKKRGIIVCNVPLYGETTVAEHTFALILSLSRMIHDSYERTSHGDFTCEGVRGFDLNGKVLGVLGTGRIGTKVIEIARGFKMNVLAYDKHPDLNLADVLDFQYTNQEDLLKSADVLTLHLPLNGETYHFLNRGTIKIMKKTAIVINTARWLVPLLCVEVGW